MLSRRDSRRGFRAVARPDLLAFVIAGRPRALSLGLVAGVAEIGTVTRLPSSDPVNLGLIVHGGAVLPLLDLGRRLAGTPAPARGETPAAGGTPAGGGTGRAAAETAAGFCIITRSEPAVAFPVEAVLGLQSSSAGPDQGLDTDQGPSTDAAAARPWELLDPLLVDLARDQDPAD
jgi:chemotaxis signal transduction protein